MRPPYFPVHFSELRGDIRFHDVSDDDLAIGDAKVTVRPVPHVGPTNGYRIELGRRRRSPTSATTRRRSDGSHDGRRRACSSCATASTCSSTTRSTRRDEFAEKAHWGHCTVDYAVHVAKEAGARRLALFHHDPSHGDDVVDQLLDAAQCIGALAGVPRSWPPRGPRPRPVGQLHPS